MRQVQFQFTPLREGRRSTIALMSSSFLFQFTPLREGRLQRSKRSASPSHFNSRPSARGDTPAELPNAPPAHFNSRPSARGDDVSPDSEGKLYIFQFTPLREGRRVLITSNECIERISIHAPPRGATDVQQEAAKPTAFQFTPLREGRRGTVYPPANFNFNSRPSARGDAHHLRRPNAGGYFNSRPSARGDIDQIVCLAAQKSISIHAPPRGATARSWRLPATWRFQFTPLREGRQGVVRAAQQARISIHAPPRGATPARFSLRASCTYFNSRPSARGDGGFLVQGRIHLLFQFTPLREGRRRPRCFRPRR